MEISITAKRDTFVKVLHIINNLDGGGAEKLLADLLPALKQHGLDIELLLLYPQQMDTPYLNTIQSSGVRIHQLGVKKGNYLSTWLHAYRFIRKHAYDCIHTHLFPAFYLVLFAKFLSKCKWIYTEHGIYNRRQSLAIYRAMDRLAYGSMDTIVAISEEVKRVLIQRGVRENAIVVIPNGIALSQYKPLHFSSFSHVIGMAARMEYPKDQETLLRAMTYLPDHITLSLAGTGSMESNLKQLAVTLGIEHRVLFNGFVSPLQPFFESIDIQVFSTRYEGFGLAVLEGLAMGIPAVVSDIPTLHDVAGDAAISFPVGNAKALAEAVLTLYNSKENFLDKKKRALKNAARFDMRHTVLQYTLIYR